AASDMLFVVAAGNDGADLELAPSYPASYHLDNLITVANLRYDGNLDPTSSYGASSVDLAAPGTHILSTTPGNSYSYMTGTSMAAPMVSAAAAMLYSQFPDATLADVKDILLSSVQKLDSLTGLTATGGMLD
ncbi:NADH:flavin oxidoreductase/NADH oxidase N-terminal domain-containing protein, partial [Dysosmobacter welbionis]